jgi:hypothetical protein
MKTNKTIVSDIPADSNQSIEKFLKTQTPQIESIPGIPAKEQKRYRVMVGDEILGTHLTIDQALELAAKRGKA